MFRLQYFTTFNKRLQISLQFLLRRL